MIRINLIQDMTESYSSVWSYYILGYISSADVRAQVEYKYAC